MGRPCRLWRSPSGGSVGCGQTLGCCVWMYSSDLQKECASGGREEQVKPHGATPCSVLTMCCFCKFAQQQSPKLSLSLWGSPQSSHLDRGTRWTGHCLTRLWRFLNDPRHRCNDKIRDTRARAWVTGRNQGDQAERMCLF